MYTQEKLYGMFTQVLQQETHKTVAAFIPCTIKFACIPSTIKFYETECGERLS